MVSRNQLLKSIQILKQGLEEDFKEVKDDMKQVVESFEGILQRQDKAMQNTLNDVGKAQIVYGFDDKYFLENKHSINHSLAVQEFIKDWLIKQSDWKYPLMMQLPFTFNYTEHAIKSSLCYILTNNFTLDETVKHVKTSLSKTERARPSMFRIKPLDYYGNITNSAVPFGQIGSIFSLDLLTHCSIEQIGNFIKSFANILRPGGTGLIHCPDCDNEDEWNAGVGKTRTYCNKKIFEDFCKRSDLVLEEIYHVDSLYTFYLLKKPGVKKSIKGAMTLIALVKK